MIDNIYCNASDIAATCKSGVLRISISDHYATFCIINNSHIKAEKETKIRRNYCQKSISRFNKCLKEQSWISLNTLDLQKAFSWFQRVIDLHIEEHFPKQTITMNCKNRLPWMTEKLRNQIKVKNAMHTEIMLNPADHLLKVEYKKLRNELTSALRNSELNHYSDDLELHKRDFHKTWNVLKVILGKDGNNSKRKIKFLVNGNYITDSTEIANRFNIFFCVNWTRTCKKYCKYY